MDQLLQYLLYLEPRNNTLHTSGTIKHVLTQPSESHAPVDPLSHSKTHPLLRSNADFVSYPNFEQLFNLNNGPILYGVFLFWLIFNWVAELSDSDLSSGFILTMGVHTFLFTVSLVFIQTGIVTRQAYRFRQRVSTIKMSEVLQSKHFIRALWAALTRGKFVNIISSLAVIFVFIEAAASNNLSQIPLLALFGLPLYLSLVLGTLLGLAPALQAKSLPVALWISFARAFSLCVILALLALAVTHQDNPPAFKGFGGIMAAMDSVMLKFSKAMLGFQFVATIAASIYTDQLNIHGID